MGFKVNSGVETEGIPMYLIEPLLSHVPINYFIESGTAGGLSIREASKYFKVCHTIELIENRAIIDRGITNIKWHTGNSVDILPKIVGELVSIKNAMQIPGQNPVYNYALFFLDAHYSDPTPNISEYKECYLLEELEIISIYQDSAIIFIDDARLFFGHPPAPNDPNDWPDIRQIFSLFEKKFPFNTTTIRDDFIISYPERLDEPMDKEWVDRYSIRYPSAEDKLKSEVKNVYNAFKKYIDVNK